MTQALEEHADSWNAAKRAMENAYAPYSNFRVGAALRSRSGDIVVGCNVENAAYPSGVCAERAAVLAAVAAGLRDFEALYLVTESERPTPPCGACRQVLIEFAPTLHIYSRARGGAVARWELAELLPTPFTPTSLLRG